MNDVSALKHRLFKYIVPVTVASFIFNIPKFFEATYVVIQNQVININKIFFLKIVFDVKATKSNNADKVRKTINALPEAIGLWQNSDLDNFTRSFIVVRSKLEGLYLLSTELFHLEMLAKKFIYEKGLKHPLSQLSSFNRCSDRKGSA